MHISLANNLEHYVKGKVSSGMYHDASEVINEALRLLSKFEKLQDHRLELLQQAISVGIFQAENNLFSETSILDLIDKK